MPLTTEENQYQIPNDIKYPKIDVQSEDFPEFSTLFWDNIKTTAYFGCTTGVIVGAIPGMLAGAAPGLLCCGMPPVMLGGAMVGGTITGFFVGLPLGLVTGFFSTICFSLPFTVTAQYTRQFKKNAEISDPVDWISQTQDKHHQEYIIKKIIEANNEKSFGIRSMGSYELMRILKKNETSLTEKWAALTNYMNEKTDNGVYIHNGKKLFNTILHSVEQYKTLISPLHCAAANGEIDTIQTLINNPEQPINLNTPFNCIDHPFHGKTAFHLAIEFKHTEIVLELIKVSTNCVLDQDKNHPIHLAAKNGDLNLFKALLKNDPNLINKTNRLGETPLICAAANNHQEIVKFLIEQNAELNMKDHKYKKTALQWARGKSCYDIANLLADHGALDPETNQLKLELKKLIEILQSNDWQQLGWGLFSKHTPARIELLKKYIKDQNIQINAIDTLSRKMVQVIARDFLNTIMHRERSSVFRDSKTETLYRLIESLGKNQEHDFSPLSAFIKTEHGNQISLGH